jgi:hypothetical protein
MPRQGSGMLARKLRWVSLFSEALIAAQADIPSRHAQGLTGALQ